jgi:hypothetical protein
VGQEKHFFIINFNESTYNVKTGHRFVNLILGSSSNILQLLFSVSLFAQGWLKGWDNGNVQLGRVSFLLSTSLKWDPYPFFYKLEGARYLVQPSTMHGREFQLTHPKLCFSSATFLFSCFCRYTWVVLGQLACTRMQ